MYSFEHLFQPIRLGALEISNRIVMCPMGTNFATEEGMPSQQMANYYAERAKGGVGLIIVEHTAVQPSGRSFKRMAGMWDDKFIPGWRMVVDAVHAHNGKVAIQLGHIGPSGRSLVIGEKPHSPSPLPDYLAREVPHEMSRDEIQQFVREYVAAVRRAVQAGFDAIEIHCTHGYLIASFLSGRTNRRTDEYGGTLEGRLRLPREIVREVRRAVGPSYPLLARIASVEPNGGRLLEETKVIAHALAEEGLDAIDVSAGSYFELEWEIPPYFFSPGFNFSNVESIKRSVGIPVIAGGRITEPRFAELLIAEGRADMVGIGRGLIADPEWPKKAASGQVDDIRRCIGCVRCVDELRSSDDMKLKCNVNPYVGKEGQITIRKANKRKKVLVIGGGPTGLYAAAIAALRGHDVTLWEKESTLGGQVRISTMPPKKHEMASIISWLNNEVRKYGGKVELGKEASLKSILAFKPDVAIVATGASALIPNIPGIDGMNVVSANAILLGKATVGNRVLVAGGGAVGCEVAQFLAGYDKDITIVEMLDEIGNGLPFVVRPMMLKALGEHKVNMLTSACVKEILQDGVAVLINGNVDILHGYDNIVIAMGSKSENELYDRIKAVVPEAYLIGDARQPRKIMEALGDALEVALII